MNTHLRDLTPEELRYANRDVLANHLAKVQEDRARLTAGLTGDSAQAEIRRLQGELEQAFARINALTNPTSPKPVTARFGVAVDSSNGAHVRFRVFAATGGCGHLVMRTDEYAAFRALLEPALTDQPDPAGDLADENCSYRDDPGHDHEQCLQQHAAAIAADLTLNAKDCLRRTAGDFVPKRGPAPAFATTETIRSLSDQGLTVYTGDDYHLTDLGRLVVDALRRAEAVTSR